MSPRIGSFLQFFCKGYLYNCAPFNCSRRSLQRSQMSTFFKSLSVVIFFIILFLCDAYGFEIGIVLSYANHLTSLERINLKERKTCTQNKQILAISIQEHKLFIKIDHLGLKHLMIKGPLQKNKSC